MKKMKSENDDLRNEFLVWYMSDEDEEKSVKVSILFIESVRNYNYIWKDLDVVMEELK